MLILKAEWPKQICAVDKSRRGRFRIAAVFLQDAPEVVKEIMGQCLIVRAEHLYINDEIEYHAICEHFRPIEFIDIVPEYDVLIEYSPALNKYVFSRFVEKKR